MAPRHQTMVSINCCLLFFLFWSLFRCIDLSSPLARSSSCFQCERLASSSCAFVASVEVQVLLPNEYAIFWTLLLPSPSWYVFLLLLRVLLFETRSTHTHTQDNINPRSGFLPGITGKFQKRHNTGTSTSSEKDKMHGPKPSPLFRRLPNGVRNHLIAMIGEFVGTFM